MYIGDKWLAQVSRVAPLEFKAVNKSVYFFVYGFRLTFAVFMDGDLPNSFSAASFIGEQTIILH